MRVYQILMCLLLSFSLVQGQICDGNLGENIFLQGDFGSGSDNVLQIDPGIAQGYEYTTIMPPNDGQYTITSDIGKWPAKFDWLSTADNSNNPDGYMMVVNASFEPGLFYEQTVSGLCGNTIYEFSADVFNVIGPGKNYIKPNVSFLIDGVQQYTTGSIPENAIWNTYGFVFTTDPGQTEVTLSLKNNAPGGIGNDLCLDNITFRPCGPTALILPTEIANICEDGSTIDLDATIQGEQYDSPAYQWQRSFDEGITWVDLPGANNAIYTHTEFASGFYYYRYLLANAEENLLNPFCRVVSNEKIVHVVPKFYEHADTICQGLTYQINGEPVTSTGAYVDSLISSIGCDSIVTLNLLFIEDKGISVNYEVQYPTCSNKANGFIFLQQVFNAYNPIQAFVDGNVVDMVVDSLDGGIHLLEIEDKFGCTYEEEIELLDPEPFTVDLGTDIEIPLGESITVNALFSEVPNEILWTPFGIVDCEYCSTFQWFPTNDITLEVTGYSDIDCEAKDQINIRVEKVRKVYIPNTFSPNNDGLNEKFVVHADQPNVTEIVEFAVFNRWGEKIFEQTNFPPNDPDFGWNGLFKNRPINGGTYIYLAKVLFLDGEILNYSGTVNLYR